jgi:hypothetical protein
MMDFRRFCQPRDGAGRASRGGKVNCCFWPVATQIDVRSEVCAWGQSGRTCHNCETPSLTQIEHVGARCRPPHLGKLEECLVGDMVC